MQLGPANFLLRYFYKMSLNFLSVLGYNLIESWGLALKTEVKKYTQLSESRTGNSLLRELIVFAS